MNDKIEEAINRIQELKRAFSQQLPVRIDELVNSTLNLDGLHSPCSANNIDLIQIIHDLAHKLSGSTGTFQFTEVYNTTKKLEVFCHSLLITPENFPENWPTQINQLLADIKHASSDTSKPLPQKSKSATVTSSNDFITASSHKIILVDDDELLSSLIQEQAKHFGYDISCINNPDELSTFLEHNSPEVILMDIVFPNYSITGIELINQLKADNKIHCPVIFLSNRDDFTARLEGVRAGGNGYIVKPVNILELVEILDKHTHKTIHDSYRALIIDDDDTISTYFKELLEAHNFNCQIVTNPLIATEVLITFQPDVILLDINMPGCNGFEIAEVIRQDNRFTHIPIVFLTVTGDNNSKIQALKSGGNCLIKKDTNKDLFISTVINHSLRSKELHAVFNRLRKDEIRFQAVSHSSSDAIITLNQEGLITLWNEGAENIFGYQSIEVIGQSIEIIIPPAHRESHRTGFQKLLANSEQLSRHSIESQAITKDHRLISIELTYTEWLSGNERFFTSIIRDTSHRKSIENELANQQENLKAIVTNSAEGIITIDGRGIIEMANPKALEIFAYKAEELEGQNISALMPKQLASQHDRYLKYSDIHAPKIINKARELQGMRKDGSIFPMELNVSPMTINGIKKYVGILHDITERKNALEAITAAKKAAENANKAKSQFLSSMSHELRTPLNVILGFTQLVLEDKEAPLNADQTESLEHIYSSGEHLLGLINEILDLSKIESGNVNINSEPINLIQLIKQTLESISPQAKKAHITITHQLPIEENIIVTADPLRVNQILCNLLSNSIKYNQDQGSVSIWLSQHDDKVRFFVKNTGQGIPDDKLKDLFTPFNRLGADKSGIEGSGIGLTITKMLVEMMGGTIGVENTYGSGCSFWVEFKQTRTLDTKKTILSSASHSKPQEQNSNINILYIEDNISNRLLMKKTINSYTNFQFSEAPTGIEGIEMALKIKPQIILLDINLPDIDGYEVLKQLQKHRSMDATKIIAVSANAMPEDIGKGEKTQLFSYITKPIEQQRLLSVINKALE
ncbi:MAG: response regulator [Methylomarinum sp.]|nr:response regulator [Methylomarinum sp.]